MKTPVNFYEREFYVLSNFSAFEVVYNNNHFKTSEHAYQAQKFGVSSGNSIMTDDDVRYRERYRGVQCARSAHDAFKYAETHKADRRPDWDQIKVDVMRDILREKAKQHEYVSRKLLETSDRPLIEMSWRDSFWGWGADQNGENMLGRLWMEVRSELQ